MPETDLRRIWSGFCNPDPPKDLLEEMLRAQANLTMTPPISRTLILED